MSEEPKLRWGLGQRLEFIESKLVWEGRINRGDLVDTFGVSVPQASSDLKQYQERAPENIEYDASAKCYVATADLSPVFESSSADAFLDDLLTGSGRRTSAFSVGFVPPPKRSLKPKVLERVARAIASREQIHVRYQSISGKGKEWRWIAPHAFGFDWFRWHTRAFCVRDQKFKDFVIARILEVKEATASEVEPEQDCEWNTELVLVIGPHPGLSEDQRKAIELDYGMTNGRAHLTVREAMAYYVKQRLGLGRDSDSSSPEQQQIILLETKRKSGDNVSP